MKVYFLVIACILQACTRGPIPGPDKQFEEGFKQAIASAGSGAILGAQVSATFGPGAFLGAGIGAIAGGIQGMQIDAIEEERIVEGQRAQFNRERAWIQSKLIEHYNQRLELHPDRDIYPADWFFSADRGTLSYSGEVLMRELSILNRNRLPWSRLKIVVYQVAKDDDSVYARALTKERAESIANAMIKYGIQPRRLVPFGQILNAPVLIDPLDEPSRYSQAIEFVPVDYKDNV